MQKIKKNTYINENNSDENVISVTNFPIKKKVVFKIKTVRFSKDTFGKNTFSKQKFKNVKLQIFFKIFI